MKRKILLGLTTITPGQWKNKVKEIDELGIKEIALFPTCLNLNQRKILYKLLEKTGIRSIPHVHLREQDNESWELDYFVRKYGTKAFNVHNDSGIRRFLETNKKYRKMIFLENTSASYENFTEILKLCGGICLDLSHYYDRTFMMTGDQRRMFDKLLKLNKIGLNHISAVGKKIMVHHDDFTGKDHYGYNKHWFENLNEFDYVKKYKKFLASIISLELENPLIQQVRVKNYLGKIINYENINPWRRR